MAEKEIAEAFEILKIERIKSFRVRGKIISQWNLKPCTRALRLALEMQMRI